MSSKEILDKLKKIIKQDSYKSINSGTCFDESILKGTIYSYINEFSNILDQVYRGEYSGSLEPYTPKNDFLQFRKNTTNFTKVIIYIVDNEDVDNSLLEFFPNIKNSHVYLNIKESLIQEVYIILYSDIAYKDPDMVLECIPILINNLLFNINKY